MLAGATEARGIEGKAGAATVARPTLGYLVIHGAAGLLGFATYFAFSRTVAPAAYADYALVIATATAINAFLYSWIGISLNRWFQDPRVDQASYVSSLVGLFAVISAAVVLVQLGIFGLWPQPIPMIIVIGCPAISVLWAWYELSLQLSRARMQVARYGLKMVLRAGLLLGLGAALAVFGWGAAGLLVALGIGLLAAGLSALPKDLEGFALRLASFGPLRELYAYGWPLALCMGLSWVVGMSDRYLIYWLIDEEAAGQYALAYGFAQQPVWLALLASSRGTLPMAARAYEREGEAGAKAVLSRNLGTMLLICLPVVALEVIAAPQLNALFLGEAYARAGAVIMPIVAIAILLQGLRAFHLDIAVHLAKRTRVLIGLWALAAGANVMLNLILIPHLGIVGAAWATLIAHVVAIGYFLLRVPRPQVLGLDRRDLFKITGALLVFAGCLFLLPEEVGGVWFLAGTTAAGLTYGVMGCILNPIGLRPSLRRALPRSDLRRLPIVSAPDRPRL